MVENKELIKNRQLMYQKAYESKEDIKSTISACIGSGASMAGGLAIMLSTLSAPSWILGLLGAGVAVTPIGWGACGVGAFGAVAIPTITKIIKDKNKTKNVISNLNIEDNDKNFLPILFYPSLYLIEQISKNKEVRLSELKVEIKRFIDESETEKFVNDFFALSEEDKSKEIFYSPKKMKQKPLPYFIKESKNLCDKMKNNEGIEKSKYEAKIKEIFGFIAHGLSLSAFSTEDNLETLISLYVYLFLRENDDRLNIPAEDNKQLNESYKHIIGMDKISTIKQNIKEYLKSFIKEESDILSLVKMEDNYSNIIRESLITTKNKYKREDDSFNDVLNKYIESLVSNFEKDFQSILDKEYPLLKNKEIRFLFDRIEKLEEENLKLQETFKKK